MKHAIQFCPRRRLLGAALLLAAMAAILPAFQTTGADEANRFVRRNLISNRYDPADLDRRLQR